jgi:Asp/Glu/hydantoin racemase
MVLARMNQENAPSGVLVACYSDHPLVDMLKKDVTRPGFHTLDIFEASIKAAVKSIKPSEKFGVVTTGKAWEPLLTDGALRMLSEGSLGDDVEPDSFAGVVGTGLGVLELHEGDSSNVKSLMAQAAKELVSKGAAAICLGCAGMSGLEAIVDSAVNTDDSAKKVLVIDGVKAGIEILRGLLTPGNA